MYSRLWYSLVHRCSQVIKKKFSENNFLLFRFEPFLVWLAACESLFFVVWLVVGIEPWMFYFTMSPGSNVTFLSLSRRAYSPFMVVVVAGIEPWIPERNTHAAVRAPDTIEVSRSKRAKFEIGAEQLQQLQLLPSALQRRSRYFFLVLYCNLILYIKFK